MKNFKRPVIGVVSVVVCCLLLHTAVYAAQLVADQYDDKPQPLAPTNLSSVVLSSSQITISWTDNSNDETGFAIERAPQRNGSAGKYVHISSVSANVTSYGDTGLTAVTTYYYRVRAYNNNGSSAYSTALRARIFCLTQNTITWVFDKEYQYGQFVTGDYWVVDTGAGVVISTTSHSDNLTFADAVTSVNPPWGDQGYESRLGGYSHYTSALAASMPLTARAGNSVVTVTRLLSQADNHAWLNNCAILTVVDVPQSSDKFRPPYCRPSRVGLSASDPLIFSINSIPQAKWDLLPRKSRSGVADVPALSSTFSRMRGPWLDHLGTSAAGDMHPYMQMSAYGGDLSKDISRAATQLCLDYTDTELKILSYYIIQIGIDNYGMLLSGAAWQGNGGINPGRKFPIVFASVMLNNTNMKNFRRKFYDFSVLCYCFAEDEQTYYYDDPELAAFQGPPPHFKIYDTDGAGRYAVRGVKGWMDKVNGGAGDIALWRIYGQGSGRCVAHEHLNVIDWSMDSELQVKSEAYRSINASAWIGQAFFMLLLGSEPGFARNEMISVWNHDPFIDFCLRWKTQSDVAPSALLMAKFGKSYQSMSKYTGITFLDTLWESYKSGFQPMHSIAAISAPPAPSSSASSTSQINFWTDNSSDESGLKYIVNLFVPSNSIPITDVALYSANGSQLFTKKLVGTGLMAVSFNVTTIAKGIYFLKITNGNQIIKDKLIF